MTKAQSSKSSGILLPLLTWGLRLCCLETVPPGWRDDELINIHALSGELLTGRFPLYFTGASGHEPLYHYLHAGVHAVLGFNVLSGHLLSVALGTLTVALAYALTRRLFGRLTALVASLMLASSFWSLMYSRIAIRHISVLPCTLAAFYVFWRSLNDPTTPSLHRPITLGLILGLSLYTYPAARLLPGLLILFSAYLALFHRDRFRSHWRGLLVALAVVTLLAAPLGAAIARGRTEAAAQGIGADARLAELAVPLRELRAGNPRPLLEHTWTTLGMFHATGDPEWLYNISNRPVFGWPGGVLLWAGVALCLVRWRQPRYFFILLWLALGLSPALISIPPASLSHTILAQPLAYILPALVLAEAHRYLRSCRLPPAARQPLKILCYLSLVVFPAANAIRDLHDYFITWPQRGMVRFLYRADYRQAANYLNAHPEITDLAVSSALMGPWDRLALDVDIQRDDVSVRLFNPERALVWVGGYNSQAPHAIVLLTSSPRPAPPIDDMLVLPELSETDTGPAEPAPPHLELYTPANDPVLDRHTPLARFTNGLELIEAHWMNEDPPAPGQKAILLTTWLVATQLDLPPIPIVANPPPPDVYAGPRLAVFTHLLALDETPLSSDDGLWVDPLTLRPGDRFLQVHHLVLPHDAPGGPYLLELGLYDPMTGSRWPIMEAAGQSASDRLLIPIGGEQ